jgi:hypothetical protein
MMQFEPPEYTEAIVKRALYNTFAECSHVLYGDDTANVPAKVIYSEDDVWENVSNAEDYGFETTYYGCFDDKNSNRIRVTTNAILGFHLPLRFFYTTDGIVCVLDGDFDGFSNFDSFGDLFVRNLRDAAEEFNARIISII